MNSRRWNFLLVAALVCSNLFWLYKVFDAGISATYQDASLDRLDKDFRQLLILFRLNALGMDADKVRQVIGKDVYGNAPFIKDGCLVVAQLCLKLDSTNRVISIEAD